MHFAQATNHRYHHNKNSQNQFCFCQREKIKSFICTTTIKKRGGGRRCERDMRGRRRGRERYGVFLFTWSRRSDLALCSCRTYTSICKSGNCEHLQMCLMLCHLVLANEFNCHSHPPLCCNIHVIWHPPPTHPAPTRCMMMLVVVVVFVLLSSSGSRRRCAFHTKKKPVFAETEWRQKSLLFDVFCMCIFSLCADRAVVYMCIFSLGAERDVFCMWIFSLCADRDRCLLHMHFLFVCRQICRLHLQLLFVCRQRCLLLDLFQYQQTKEANWRRRRTRGGGFVPYLLQIVTKLLCSEKREHPARKHQHSACWVAQGSLMAADLVCRSTESHSLFHCADLVHYPIPLPPTLPRILPLLPHTSQFLFHCCCLWETTLSAPHRSNSNSPSSLPLPRPQRVVLLLASLAVSFCFLQILGRVWVMIIWPIPITRTGKKKKNPMREEKKKGFLSCILSFFLLLLPVLGFEFCLLWIFVGLEEGTRRHQNFFSLGR